MTNFIFNFCTFAVRGFSNSFVRSFFILICISLPRTPWRWVVRRRFRLSGCSWYGLPSGNTESGSGVAGRLTRRDCLTGSNWQWQTTFKCHSRRVFCFIFNIFIDFLFYTQISNNFFKAANNVVLFLYKYFFQSKKTVNSSCVEQFYLCKLFVCQLKKEAPTQRKHKG